MPYVITVKTHPETSATLAVATLDEARATTYGIVRENAIGQTGTAWQRAANKINHPAWPYLEDSTISLPDGTVIEVRRVEKFELGFGAGLIAADHPQLWSDADLVAAFNRANA